ncbi:phosphatidate cytidylyltransferase [Clostridiisalibacter paucivorans]|uniref:phosphatidate cytidylyltransferase n=1 Tax=Clostridiisalibacter paucivorans TaxID=408753 RepID=UPI00047BFEEB|nr:phosphatidate cytidylyltransferase [Clostridiisalibacter paucivorans]
MKIRVISGIIGLIFLLIVVFTGGILLNIGVFTMATIGIYEYNRAIKSMGFNPISKMSYVFSLAFFLSELIELRNYHSPLIFCYTIILLIIMVFKKEIRPQDIAMNLLGSIYIVFFIFHVQFMAGSIYIWIIFITAWATDTFAYFTGMFFGKNKLCPTLSPKKTIEGSIGGTLGSFVVTFIFVKAIGTGNLLQLLPLSIICAIIAQLGDLTASKIKRIASIKDYGSIMPGHGGVLDRFDSILFTAPTVYYYMTIFVLR